MRSRHSIAERIRSASRGVLNHPDLVRNRAFGALNYWPVSPLSSVRLRKVPYFCINLKSDRKRRLLALRQARKMGLENFRFVEGIVGANLDIQELIDDGLYDDRAALRFHGRSLSPAEIGLSLTHASIYKMIVEEGLDEAVILEDDVLFLTRNLDGFDKWSIPESFDVLFLHAHVDEAPPRGKIADHIFSDASYQASSVAYLVSHKGAVKLAAGALPVVHASDGLLGRAMSWNGNGPHAFRQQGANFELSSYIIYPPAALNGSTCHFFSSSISG